MRADSDGLLNQQEREMATAKSWEEATAAAQKILGNKGKIPVAKANVFKLFHDISKLRDELATVVITLEDKLGALENANSAWRNALKPYDAELSKSDFGLDGGNPDDKKKIRQAQDIMTGYVELLMGQADTNTKHLDELGKHAKAISKFTSD
jgi:hypothetical protein